MCCQCAEENQCDVSSGGDGGKHGLINEKKGLEEKRRKGKGKSSGTDRKTECSVRGAGRGRAGGWVI